MPLYKLQVSYYGPPCFSINRVTGKQTPLFDYLNIKEDCGVYGQDPDVITLDFIPEQDLYKYNGLSNFLSTIDGYYETTAGEDVYLVTRYKVRLIDSPYCFEARGKRSGDLSKTVEDVDANSVILIVQIVFQFIYLAIFFVLVGCWSFFPHSDTFHVVNLAICRSLVIIDFCFVLTLELTVGAGISEIE